MNPVAARWGRHAAIGHVVAVFVGAGSVVYAAVGSHWLWLAAGALALATAFIDGPLSIAVVTFAILTGAWLAAASAAVNFAAWICTQLVARYALRAPFNEAALIEFVEGISPSLRSQIEAIENERVDTVSILRAAVRADPQRWQSAPQQLADRNGSEGGPVGRTRWTVAAAEAALVANCRPDSTTALNLHILAAAGLLLPYSAAGAAFERSKDALLAATAVLGLSAGQAAAQLTRASRQPGGELIVARVGLANKGTLPLGTELPDDVWERLRAAGGALVRQNRRAPEDRGVD